MIRYPGYYMQEMRYEISPFQSGLYTCKGRRSDTNESEKSAAVQIVISSGQYMFTLILIYFPHHNGLNNKWTEVYKMCMFFELKIAGFIHTVIP